MDMDRTACYRAISTRDARFDGRLFVGVKTTGIYCRPICPARTPKLENVAFYRLARRRRRRPAFGPACAAGPRPRPSSAAGAAPRTRCRARCADRRRRARRRRRRGARRAPRRRRAPIAAAFDQHLGASPIAVAQTRRVLLAKQLMHETRCRWRRSRSPPGFGSVRRFNETFRHSTGARRRRCGGRATRRGAKPARCRFGCAIARRTTGPRCCRSCGPRDPGRRVVAGDSYAARSRSAGSRGMSASRPPQERARRDGPLPELAALPPIIARVRRVFDLAADPARSARISRRSGAGAAGRGAAGLRVPGAWDGFELAVRAVLGQQITVTAATNCSAARAAWRSARLAMAARASAICFPTASASRGPDLALGMPGARALAVIVAGAAFAAIRNLRRGQPRRCDAKLRALPGIGEWTAQYIAMRELREPDAFPAADIGLLRTMTDGAAGGPTPSDLLAAPNAGGRGAPTRPCIYGQPA